MFYHNGLDRLKFFYEPSILPPLFVLFLLFDFYWLVGCYGISGLVGYLMPKPIYDLEVRPDR